MKFKLELSCYRSSVVTGFLYVEFKMRKISPVAKYLSHTEVSVFL